MPCPLFSWIFPKKTLSDSCISSLFFVCSVQLLFILCTTVFYIWSWFFSITVLYMILILPRHYIIYVRLRSTSNPQVNSSLSNLYNNVIIYTIKKKSWEQFCLWTKCTEFSYSCYKGIIYWRVLVPNVNNSSIIEIKTFR